jgi:Cu(I)/Ag(I) efflux system membrane protein CusA/SilA
MVGGLVSSFALELLVYPAVYLLWRRREVSEPATVQS